MASGVITKKEELSDLMLVKSVSKQVTTTYDPFTMTAPTVTGYTPIGIIGVTTNNSTYLSKFYLSGNTVNIRIYSTSGSSMTFTATVYILYIKNL